MPCSVIYNARITVAVYQNRCWDYLGLRQTLLPSLLSRGEVSDDTPDTTSRRITTFTPIANLIHGLQLSGSSQFMSFFITSTYMYCINRSRSSLTLLPRLAICNGHSSHRCHSLPKDHAPVASDSIDSYRLLAGDIADSEITWSKSAQR